MWQDHAHDVKPLPPDWCIPQGANAEMRWDAMRDQSLLVPDGRFFVRNHTATPRIEAASWRLCGSSAVACVTRA